MVCGGSHVPWILAMLARGSLRSPPVPIDLRWWWSYYRFTRSTGGAGAPA